MNIVLCGFMGCGKSTVGKRLAARLNMTFVDMDSFIEEKAGCSIAAIFADHGEAHFRQLEHDACRALAQQNDLVIATGGGAILRQDNVDALRQGGTLIWLKVGADCVIERLKNDTSRPLLQRPNKAQAVRELMEARAPFYAAADLTVDAEADTDTVVDRILESRSMLRI